MLEKLRSLCGDPLPLFEAVTTYMRLASKRLLRTKGVMYVVEWAVNLGMYVVNENFPTC